MAAAAGTARTAFKVFRGRHAPEFKRFCQELVDLFLYVVHRFLRIDKTLGHRIAEKRLALRIKSRNLRWRKLQSLLLLVLQVTALFSQRLVLLLGFGIGHKRIHLLANASKLGLLNDGLAQFPCLLENRILSLNICFHNISRYATRTGAVHLICQHFRCRASNKFAGTVLGGPF